MTTVMDFQEVTLMDKPITEDQENLVLHHRSILKEKLNSVLHSHRFCAVCFESNKTFKSLDEELTIISDNWTQTILLKHVYTYVFKQTETSASGYICTECTTQLQQAYIFIKYSQLTKQLLDSYVNELKYKTDEIMSHMNKVKCSKNNTLIILESCESDKYIMEKKTIKEVNPQIEMNEMDIDDEIEQWNNETEIVETKSGLNKTNIIRAEKDVSEKVVKTKTVQTKPGINKNIIVKTETGLNKTNIVSAEKGVSVKRIVNADTGINKTKTVQTKRKNISSSWPGPMIFNNQQFSTIWGQARIVEKEKRIRETQFVFQRETGINKMNIIKIKTGKRAIEIVGTKTGKSAKEIVGTKTGKSAKEIVGAKTGIDKNILVKTETSESDIVDSETDISTQKESKLTNHCKICNIEFKTRNFLITHNKKNHILCMCMVCNKEIFIAILENHLKEHEEENEKRGMVLCEVCNKIFSNKVQLTRHIQCHAKKKRIKRRKYNCKECDFVTQVPNYLDKHINEKHLNIKPYSCDICGKEFSGKHVISKHMRTWHLPRQKIKCHLCGKQYYRSQFGLHMKIHKGIKEHQCEKCGKRFRKAHVRTQHVLRVHSDNVESCPLCSRKFKVIQDVRRHIMFWHWKRNGNKGEFDPRKIKGLENYYHLFPVFMEKLNLSVL